MKFYSKNITPDSLTGAVFALEGIKNSIVLLNSPTGCKFYHSAISDYQYTRQLEFDPLNYPEKFYFGQPRVPCTYLDKDDYVYGSKYKLEEILDFIKDKDTDLVAAINSPGASLIGDDLNGILYRKIKNTPYIRIETTGFSQSFYKGFQNSLISLLKNLNLEECPKINQKIVNIIGVSIYDKYYEGDIKEIKRLLNLCNIKVNCVLCADTNFDALKNINKSSLNIVLYPELGIDIAEYLEEKYNIPYFSFDKGLPIGFDLTEQFIKSICEILNADYSNFILNLEKARAKSYIHISRLNSLTGLPKGSTFSIKSISSKAYSYTNFLINYFGMIPSCINFIEDDPSLFKDNLKSLLIDYNIEDVLNKNIYETNSDIVFSNGNTISQLKLNNHIFSGIEIDLPSLGYIDIIPKTHLGINGSLLLVEQVINGINF